MEPLLLAILIFYLIVQGIENFLTYINLKHLAIHGAEVPQGFEGHVDSETLKKMRDYTVAGSRVDLAASFFGTIIALVFLFGGVLNWYNNWLVSLQFGPVLSAVLFFLLLMYGETVIKIPFSLYSTFHIEKQYGFNTQTFGLWCADTLKGLLLSSVLTALLLSVIFRLIQATPQYWWLVVWGFLFFFTIFMLYLSPYVIEPLFNKFTPIDNESLEDRIKQVMAKGGLSISRVFSMDASKRSKHSNAYFSGIGHVKRIVLFDTLLENSTDDEILAILAHEAGHWKKKHIIKRLALMEIFALVGAYIAFRAMQTDNLAVLFGLDRGTVYAKLLLVGFLGSLVLFPLKPLSTLFSRKHEREADDFAINLTENPKALAQSLVSLGRDNLANLHPHPWYAAMYYSHPPLPRRVSRLLAKVEALSNND